MHYTMWYTCRCYLEYQKFEPARARYSRCCIHSPHPRETKQFEGKAKLRNTRGYFEYQKIKEVCWQGTVLESAPYCNDVLGHIHVRCLDQYKHVPSATWAFYPPWFWGHQVATDSHHLLPNRYHQVILWCTIANTLTRTHTHTHAHTSIIQNNEK